MSIVGNGQCGESADEDVPGSCPQGGSSCIVSVAYPCATSHSSSARANGLYCDPRETMLLTFADVVPSASAICLTVTPVSYTHLTLPTLYSV